jgi:hypothetical protein
MKKIFYAVFSICLMNSIIGCKKEAVIDKTMYYVNFSGDGGTTYTRFAANGGDYKHPTNVTSKDNGLYHYFATDNGNIHLNFGFIDSMSDFKFVPGNDLSPINTYTITRIDYGSGAAYASYSELNTDNYQEIYETDYVNDTGTLTVQYNKKLHQAKGTFTFTVLQTNPKAGSQPLTKSFMGDYLISWNPPE